mgnify:CR=1 FL=1
MSQPIRNRAVVLFSGGLDSTTCLAQAHADGHECYALSFDYGQRHTAELAAARAYEAVADRLLFDAKPPKDADRPGGNAVAFDWGLLAGTEWTVPWLLAGGLTPDNVAEAIRIAACLLEATMPTRMHELRAAWNLGDATGDLRLECEWGRLKPGTTIDKVALFPRVEFDDQA